MIDNNFINRFEYKEIFDGVEYLGILEDKKALCPKNRNIGTARLVNDPDWLIKFPEEIKENCFYFKEFHVVKRLRGKGLGSLILDKVLDFFQKNKMNIINEINPHRGLNREQLRDFYLRHGFKKLRDYDTRFVLYWTPGQEEK